MHLSNDQISLALIDYSILKKQLTIFPLLKDLFAVFRYPDSYYLHFGKNNLIVKLIKVIELQN